MSDHKLVSLNCSRSHRAKSALVLELEWFIPSSALVQVRETRTTHSTTTTQLEQLCVRMIPPTKRNGKTNFQRYMCMFHVSLNLCAVLNQRSLWNDHKYCVWSGVQCRSRILGRVPEAHKCNLGASSSLKPLSEPSD